MSSIFEAILSPAEPERLLQVLEPLEISLHLALSSLPGGLTAAVREDPRHEYAFTEDLDGIAEALSKTLGTSLVVRYDDRIGHRSSKLYRDGELIRSFGEDDEVYVLLDEDGEPIPEGERFSLQDLDPDEEYETIKNAIQLGLEGLGRGDWPSVFDLITS
jgi:hypothetical protein